MDCVNYHFKGVAEFEVFAQIFFVWIFFVWLFILENKQLLCKIKGLLVESTCFLLLKE